MRYAFELAVPQQKEAVHPSPTPASLKTFKIIFMIVSLSREGESLLVSQFSVVTTEKRESIALSLPRVPGLP